MKIIRSTQNAGGLLAILLMAAGSAVSTAQDNKLDARPLTHQDIHVYHLPEGTQASGGLHNVGLGQPVYLEAMVDIALTDITEVVWEITEQPGTDELEASPLGEDVPIYEPRERGNYQLADRRMFRPTLEGQYTISATVTADGGAPFVLTLDVTAGTYLGANTCALCHSGGDRAPNKYDPWTETGHASFFTEAIDGIKSSHYNSGCIKCHVVGYDTNELAVNGGFDDVAATVEGGEWTFPEEVIPGNWDAMTATLQNKANIQCENCHGPGSQHAPAAINEDDPLYTGPPAKDFIQVSYNSGDCAQCHSEEPYHVRPLQWENSKHAIGYQRDGSSSCGACHHGPGFIDRMNGAQGSAIRGDAGVINCSTCHDPHDPTNTHQIRSVADVTLNDTSRDGGATVVTEGGHGKICMQCHISRRDGVTYVVDQFNRSNGPSSHFGPHHGPQTDMFVGANAITYGKDIPSSSAHKNLEDSCVTCHMQATDRTSPEHLLAGDHTWNMSWDDNGSKADLVAACLDCHGGIEDFDFQQQDYDGNGLVEGVQTEVRGLLSQLAIMLPPVGVPKPDHDLEDDNHWSHHMDKTWTQPQVSAAYNYLFVLEDGSWGIHNLSYAVGLLKASIADLSGDANGDGIADWWQEQYFGSDWASDPDATRHANPSGDGVPNWVKFSLNLDPHEEGISLPDGVVWINGKNASGGTDPASVDPNTLRVYTATEVAFGTEVDKDYQIQGASDLSGGWQNIGDPIPGTGGTISYLAPTRPKLQMFYRVLHTP